MNGDCDRLREPVNHRDTIREMLGHAAFGEEMYNYQTLKDNASLFAPELLGKIDRAAVGAGHAPVKKGRRSAARAVRLLHG